MIDFLLDLAQTHMERSGLERYFRSMELRVEGTSFLQIYPQREF